MRKLFLLLFSLSIIVNIGYAQGKWRYNPFTGHRDYYVEGLSLGTAASGDIIYHNGTIWTRLAKGANTEVLTLAAGLPSWAAAGGADEKVKVDAGATAGYFGVAGGDGIFRFTADHFTMADGGNFVTLSLADHATARTALGLQIGTDVVAWDTDLDTYAGITPSANIQTFLANATFAAMMADLSGTATGAFAWNNQNLTSIGTIGSGNIVSTGTGEFQGASVTVGDADTAGTLVLSDGSNHTITIDVPAIAGSWALTLPTVDGGASEFLQTDGAGNTTWAAESAADAFTLKVDAGAAADYFGVGGGDGLFRFTANQFTMVDGGSFVTLSLADHATARTALGLQIGTDVLAEKTIGIADDNLLEVDQISPADNDFAKFTLNGLEGRSYAETAGDLEAAIETAIDTLANLTSIQGQTFTLAGSFVTQNNNVTINAITAARTITLNENFTIGGGSDVTITAEDAAGAIVLDNINFEVEDAVGSGNTIKIVNATSDASRTITLSEDLTIIDGQNVELHASGGEKAQLAIDTQNAERTLDMSANLTVTDVSTINQNVSTTGDPTFDDVVADKLEVNESFTYDAFQTATGDGDTTIDWGLGNNMYFTFGASNEIIRFTAPPGSAVVRMIIKQDGVGSRTIDWSNVANILWPGDVEPTLSTTATYVDIIVFLYDGTSWFGLFNGDFR